MKKFFLINWLLFVVSFTGLMTGGCARYGILCDSSQIKYAKTAEISDDASKIESLHINIDSGSITVRGSDTDECRLLATIKALSFTSKEAKALVDGTQIKILNSGTQMEVEVKKPIMQKFDQLEVSLEISIPHAISSKLHTSSGNIIVTGLDGSVDCSTITGSIEIKKVQGNVTANTNSGNIKLDDVESQHMELKVKTGSINGEALVDELTGAVISGNISMKCIPGSKVSDVSLSANTGCIWLTLPKDYSGNIDVSTDLGHIDSDLPQVTKNPDHKKLRGIIGNGNGKLKIKTINGGITVKMQN